MKLNPLLQLTLSLVFFVSYSNILAATPQELKDSAINQKVTEKLADKDVLAGSTIVSTTHNGIVKLYGHVNTQEQATAAIGVAEDVEDVKGVDASSLNIFTGENDTNGVPYNSTPH